MPASDYRREFAALSWMWLGEVSRLTAVGAASATARSSYYSSQKLPSSTYSDASIRRSSPCSSCLSIAVRLCVGPKRSSHVRSPLSSLSTLIAPSFASFVREWTAVVFCAFSCRTPWPILQEFAALASDLSQVALALISSTRLLLVSPWSCCTPIQHISPCFALVESWRSPGSGGFVGCVSVSTLSNFGPSSFPIHRKSHCRGKFSSVWRFRPRPHLQLLAADYHLPSSLQSLVYSFQQSIGRGSCRRPSILGPCTANILATSTNPASCTCSYSTKSDSILHSFATRQRCGWCNLSCRRGRRLLCNQALCTRGSPQQCSRSCLRIGRWGRQNCWIVAHLWQQISRPIRTCRHTQSTVLVSNLHIEGLIHLVGYLAICGSLRAQHIYKQLDRQGQFRATRTPYSSFLPPSYCKETLRSCPSFVPRGSRGIWARASFCISYLLKIGFCNTATHWPWSHGWMDIWYVLCLHLNS